MSATRVNVDNFVRAESNRMFAGMATQAGEPNGWYHIRVPTPLDQQTIIRMNRDTLYSTAVVDLTGGATVVIPEHGERYVSLAVINQDHYINEIFHSAGEHRITMDRHGTQFVMLGVRILVDPSDERDVAAVNALQDSLGLEVGASGAFVTPEYDEDSLRATRETLLELAKGVPDAARMFGSRESVEPIRHLLGTALGWGGLPETEAFYMSVVPELPVGQYSLTVHDVPVDAFWSISLYNAEGFFQESDRGGNNVNNITAVRNEDSSVTVNFGGCDDDRPNCLSIMEGWNYTVRLYRPRSEILDGTWQFPSVERIG